MEGTPSIEELNRRLEGLDRRQQQFQDEITALHRALKEFKPKETIIPPDLSPESAPEKVPETIKTPAVTETLPLPEPDKKTLSYPGPPLRESTPLEEFIGKNLLNKIGIAVLVLGVGIGAQYAIEHQLISPLTRIVLAYLMGIILIGLAYWLKPRYANFSAVLLSGGMAVLYFITFAAYNLYQLMPQGAAFVLMVLFTMFTVYAALQYNLIVIAIMGMVGAYAVPFLLSDGSGKVVILFSYVALINCGILVLAFYRNWKALYYIAFALTWLIFASWFSFQFDVKEHSGIELIFSTLYVVIFYITLLAYKLVRNEPLERGDIMLLLANSVAYYGFGYSNLAADPQSEVFLGLFTVFNGLIHFIAAVVIFRKFRKSTETFFLSAGLVLLFLTLAVPVQLDGRWVTLIWAGEAALLFRIGRTRQFLVYEQISYPLISIAFISLLQDWGHFYKHENHDVAAVFVRPLFNVQVLSTLLVCLGFGSVIFLHTNKKYPPPPNLKPLTYNYLDYIVPGILLFTLFLGFYLEGNTYWQQRIVDSRLSQGGNYVSNPDLPSFQTLWMINYCAFFALALYVANRLWIKKQTLNDLILAFSGMVLLAFLGSGLPELRFLQQSYLNQTDAEYFYHEGNLLIRYVCLLFIAPLTWVMTSLSQNHRYDENIRKTGILFMHLLILAVISTELLSVLALAHIKESDKLTLTILWGAYALGLIVYGLSRDMKYLRVGAIFLFAVTLLKLFFYDLLGMGTIAKTIVMICLGALLLVSSFLYNKVKKPTEDDAPK